MTGYAQARREQSGWAVRVSVKSVNHRFLDVKLHLPEGFDLYELRLRQAVRERIHRGHVDINVNVEPGKAVPVQVNKDLALAYLRAAETLRQETRAAADMDVVSVLRLPGVIAGLSGAVPESEDEQEKLGQTLEACLREALLKLDDMRRAEGKHLVQDLRERLARITGEVEKVRGLAATLRPAFARRLETRIKELLGGTAIDPARLAQEAALLAERSDISEELDRLRSHLQQFTKLLDGAGELGKKLDFLLQEMHREANTMLSKTPGVESEALAITGLALEIKADIEKLREQVQNIE
ncbi:MAG TPA: YicC/YloC family endoribonuclease [Candidatus Acidoferrum sp.]|nr:YicC/YloC family endoribonuclease [Candidatus Acidoferrum sp.]